ncbi:MAG: hypothetical protein JO181_22495, partial [Solirubrobacterales bacterium]|nr:hypothetical protein [Solirubrobacterales bacterium]
ALREWRRVLAPGGLLEIRTLDVIGAADLLRQRDGTAFHQHMINCLYGTQAYTGDYHLVGFTDLTLVDDLFEAGFDRVRISRRDQWLLDARARRPSGRDQPDWIAIGLDSGFYMQESDGRDSWRWCDAVAGILLFSRYREAVDVHLQLDLFRPTGEIEIELTGCGVGQRVPVGRSTTVSSTRTLIPGSNRLSLMSHGEAVPSREDPRSLHVQLRAIRATPVL